MKIYLGGLNNKDILDKKGDLFIMQEKNKEQIHAILLAGGSGTRLWPLSREELPKQFLALHNEKSLLCNTMDRFNRSAAGLRFSVVAAEQWRSIIQHQAQAYMQDGNLRLIEEPSGKNTAPAILLACLTLLNEGISDESILIVSPSDHIIGQEKDFSAALQESIDAARADHIALLGIVPTHPETGFGYIQSKKIVGRGYFPVNRFVEKPKLETAEEYLREGNWFWNGGIFVFKLRTFMQEIRLHCPELASAADSGLCSYLEAWERLPSISLDHALMEKTETLALVPLDAEWCDIGSWDAFYSLAEKDSKGNVHLGDIVCQNTANNLVISHKRLAALCDVEDLLVVDSPDALFIGKRNHSGNLRALTEKLKTESRQELLEAQESARPWGTYEILHKGHGVKIKHIIVEPGKKISLQFHKQRSEHWIVTSGTAHVTIGDTVIILNEGQSAFIPQNQTHRLENRGTIPLKIIEVQQGHYLGEDDITRIDDEYGRT